MCTVIAVICFIIAIAQFVRRQDIAGQIWLAAFFVILAV